VTWEISVIENRQNYLAAISLIFLLRGCGSGSSRVEITTFDEHGKGQLHFAEFIVVRIACRRVGIGGGDADGTAEHGRSTANHHAGFVLQYILEPAAGTTYVEATQIDAQAEYALLTPPTGVRYDGSAFITWHLDRRKSTLRGKIESGTLAPRYGWAMRWSRSGRRDQRESARGGESARRGRRGADAGDAISEAGARA